MRRFMSFEDYYKKYLTYHTKFWTKMLHVLGNLATVFFVFCVFWFDLSLFYLLVTPFIIYIFAWPSHWWIEGNKPAAFKNPIMAKRADWKMMFDMLRGKL